VYISSRIATIEWCDLSLRNQIIQHLRRSILHLIDVDAGVEQEALLANERKLVVASPRERLLRIESRPTSRRVEIELRHSEASFNFGSILPQDSLNASAKLPLSATVVSANSIRSVSGSMPVYLLACLTKA
jgi:hypothetical protein